MTAQEIQEYQLSFLRSELSGPNGARINIPHFEKNHFEIRWGTHARLRTDGNKYVIELPATGVSEAVVLEEFDHLAYVVRRFGPDGAGQYAAVLNKSDEVFNQLNRLRLGEGISPTLRRDIEDVSWLVEMELAAKQNVRARINKGAYVNDPDDYANMMKDLAETERGYRAIHGWLQGFLR